MTSAAGQKLKKRAADFETKKQLDKALSLYIQLLEEAQGDLDDADLQLYNRVGDLLTRQGNVSEALGWYEKAIDIYAERGFLNNAIALCNKVLRQSPTRSAVYYKLGKISASKGFKNDAKKNFLEYADRMQKAGQIDEAFRALKEFADLCPDQDDIRLMLAEWLTRENRKNEAVEQLETLWNKFEAEGRRPEASATLDRMKAIDPEFVPRPSGAWVSQKSSDLVFLDLATDAPIAPAAREAGDRSPTPPSSPSPSVVPAVSVPALEGLTLTFVPDEEEPVETTRPEGFVVEAEVAADVPNDSVTGLESMELEPGESPDAGALAQMGLMRDSTGAEDGIDIAALAGLESAAEEGILLPGEEPTAAIGDEPGGARYISLDLEAVMAEPPRSREITLEVELPLIEPEDESDHADSIDLLAVMATPIAIPAIAPVVGDSVTPLDILDLSDLAARPDESGVATTQLAPNEDDTRSAAAEALQPDEDARESTETPERGARGEEADDARRDTLELVAIDGSARVTDEIAIVESVEEETSGDARAPSLHGLDGDETPDSWVDAALGAPRDDLAIDRLLTPLHVPVIGALDAPIPPDPLAVDDRPDSVPADDIEAAKAEAYDFDEFGTIGAPEREGGDAAADDDVSEAATSDVSDETFETSVSSEGAASLEQFFGVRAETEQEINLLDELTPPFMRSSGNVKAVDGFTSGEVASALDSALGAEPNESDTPVVADAEESVAADEEPLEPFVAAAPAGEGIESSTDVTGHDAHQEHYDVESLGDATPIAAGGAPTPDDGAPSPSDASESSVGANPSASDDAAPTDAGEEFDFDFAAADREAEFASDDETLVGEFDGAEERRSVLDTTSLRAALALDTLAVSTSGEGEEGNVAASRRPDGTPPDEAMIEAAFRDNPIDLPLLDVGDVDTPAEDVDAYGTYDPSERATPDSFLAQPPTFDTEKESFEPEPSLSSETLSPDEWPNDVAPEVLIDGEWRDEHVGDLVSGEMSAVNGPSPTPPARFDDLAAAMMWPAENGDDGSNDDQQNGASRLLASQGSGVSFGGVEAQLRRRLEIDPGNWALRRSLGEELIGIGDRDGGLAELEIAMAGFEQLGDLDGARTVADSVLRAFPNSVRHHQKRVEYAVRSGNRAQLIEAYVELADALFRSGDAPKAHVVYSRVLELSPGNQRARVALGLIEPDEGYLPPPSTPRDATDAHSSPAMLGLFSDAGAGRVVSHSVTEEMPSIDDVTIPHTMSESSPLFATAPDPVAEAPAVAPSGDVPAGASSEKAATDDMVRAAPLTGGETAGAAGREVAAMPAPLSAPSVTEPVPSAHDDFVDLGDWLRAAEPVRSTRMVTSDVAPSGDEQADFDDMLRRFKQGIAENIDEEDFASHYDLGVAYKEMGLVDEAISEFQKALRGNHHREAAYEALGQCFVEKGQMQVAITLLRRAVETTGADDQQLVGVLYLLGFANESMERHRDALGYYQRVFAVDIEFRDVAKRVAAMEHRTK